MARHMAKGGATKRVRGEIAAYPTDDYTLDDVRELEPGQVEVARLPIMTSVDEARAALNEYAVANDVSNRTLVARVALPYKRSTARWRSYMERYERYMRRQAEYEESTFVRRRKSMYIGCKGCGSRLRVELLDGNRCPLCGEDLRSKTVHKTLDRWQERIAHVIELLDTETMKFCGDLTYVTRRC